MSVEPSPDMRSKDEVQRAHDMLVAVVLMEAPDLPKHNPDETVHFAAALCWVLRHDYNEGLDAYLNRLEDYHKSKGIFLTDHAN